MRKRWILLPVYMDGQVRVFNIHNLLFLLCRSRVSQSKAGLSLPAVRVSILLYQGLFADNCPGAVYTVTIVTKMLIALHALRTCLTLTAHFS